MSETKRYFLGLAYDGTDFAGWQIQPDEHGSTVQATVEDKLSQLFANQVIRIHSSGRTDAGVHALEQTITFNPPERPLIPLPDLQRALNHMLPDSIRIRFAKEVSGDFHARYSTVGKAYTYVINRGCPNPFTSRYSWHLPRCTDLDGIRAAAEHLTGEHDFSAFTVNRKDIDDATRTIHRIDILEDEDILCLTFVGSGFLYKMVRSLVGALALAGTGELSGDEMSSLLAEKDRSKAPKTAPANGLFLVKVFYDEPTLHSFHLEEMPYRQ